MTRFGWIGPALDAIAWRCLEGEAPARLEPRDWARAIAAALSERLGPALGDAVSALGFELPTEQRALLVAARLENEERVGAQERLLGELGPALEQKGIAPLLLKGLAIARHYPVPAVRESSDVDILVAPEWMRPVDETLAAMGFTRWPAGAIDGSPRYEIMYTREGGGGRYAPVVDLHPGWHELRLAADAGGARVGDEAVQVDRIELGGAPWRALSPEVELYLTIAHAILHNLRTLSVYLDVAILLHALDEDSLGRVVELAERNGRERHLRHALSAATDLFGVPVPAGASSLPRRWGIPAWLRLGYLGGGRRYMPSSLVLELLLRQGLGRRWRFARWVLGHGRREGVSRDAPSGGGWRSWVARLRWLSGGLLRYRATQSSPLRP